MATETRIDEIKEQDGQLIVFYTEGVPPLGPPSGLSRAYASKEAFVGMMREKTEEPDIDTALAMAASATYKADPSMRNLATFKNKSATLDFTGLAQPVILK